MGIINEQGASKLSIRSLAKSLGVQTNAIYTHYDNLDAIEEAVVVRLLDQIPLPDAASPEPLRDQLVEHFVALRSALIVHPQVTTGRVGSPAWIANARHLECAFTQLAARGVDMSTAQVAYSALSGVTLMSAAHTNAYRNADEQGDHRHALASLKAGNATQVLKMMELPQMKLPVEERFRRLIGALIDQLLPASVGKGGKKPAARRKA